MISMEMMGKIRRMYFRDKLSLHEIAKRTGLARNTIRKWVRAPEAKPPVYQRRAIFNKLSPFHATLEQALKADSLRPKQQRRSAKALLAQIKAEGYDGGYSQLTAFIRAWRGGQGKASQAFVPLTFALGEAFQFDWSEEGLLVGGIYRRMQVAHLKLCASRAFWLVAYPSQGHEMLFDAHTRSFGSLGGVPRRGIYDNMKTAVDKVGQGKSRTVNARFEAMTGHYLFEPEFCNRAAGWEKGIVEKNVQDRRRGIWMEAAERRWPDLESLNAWLHQACLDAWHELPHPEWPELTIADVWQQEQTHLMPNPAPFDGYVEQMVRVTATSLIHYQRNRYSVPCEWAHTSVSVRAYPDRLVVVGANSESPEQPVSLPRSFERGQTLYDWRHYVSLLERKPGALRNGAPFKTMPEPLQHLQAHLLRHPGGDRVMAQVLMAITLHGLDDVLVAVELALQSGRVSADHVLNVLARLKEPQAVQSLPEAALPSLTLHEPPQADVSRYDSLRQSQEDDHVQ